MNKVSYDYQFVDPSMLEETKRKCSESHFSKEPLIVEEIDNAIVLPCVDCWTGGIVDEKGNYYEQSFIQRGAGGAYDFDVDQCVFCDEEVVYIGMFHFVWGHWLTDNLKLLWFLFDEEYKYLRSKQFIFTPLSPDFIFSSTAKELLRKVGVNTDNLVRVDRITKYKKVYLPKDSFIRRNGKGCWYTNEFKLLINRISLTVGGRKWGP